MWQHQWTPHHQQQQQQQQQQRPQQERLSRCHRLLLLQRGV
jgi:hypothetical protein